MTALAGTVGAVWIAKQNGVTMDANTDTTIISDAADLDFTASQDMSVELWVRPAASFGAEKILEKYASSTGYKVELQASDYIVWTVGDGSNTPAHTGDTDIGDGAWHHVVCVRDAAQTLYLYTDGVADNGSTSDSTGATLANAANAIVGPTSSGNNLDVAVVRLYDAAISAAQASDLALGNFPSALRGNIRGEWLYHEGSGTAIYDSSGNGNPGQLTAGCAWTTALYDTETTEAVGTGDGTTKIFNLDYENADDAEGLTVTVGGTAQALGPDFTMTPRGTLTFGTAPVSDAAVVATYRHFPVTIEGGGFTSWSLDLTADPLDTTDFTTNGNRTFITGLKGWSGSADRHWVNHFGMNNLAKRVIVRFYSNEDTKYWNGWAWVTGFHPSVGVDTLVEEPVDFQGTGTLGIE